MDPDLTQALNDLEKRLSAQIDDTKVHLGGLLLEYRAEAQTENRKLSERVAALNCENIRLADRVRELEQKEVTTVEGVHRASARASLADAKADTAIVSTAELQALVTQESVKAHGAFKPKLNWAATIVAVVLAIASAVEAWAPKSAPIGPIPTATAAPR